MTGEAVRPSQVGADDVARIAFIDESMRQSDEGALYLVTAVLAGSRTLPTVEQRLRQTTRRGQRRMHWHHEADPARFRFMDTVASLPIQAVTIAVRIATPRRQEKAREVALWNLVPRLEAMAVTNLVLEARQERLNARDSRTIWSMQRAGVGAGMHYRFGQASEDIGLWVADALAGGLGLHLVERDDRYIKRLAAEQLQLHEIEC